MHFQVNLIQVKGELGDNLLNDIVEAISLHHCGMPIGELQRYILEKQGYEVCFRLHTMLIKFQTQQLELYSFRGM